MRRWPWPTPRVERPYVGAGRKRTIAAMEDPVLDEMEREECITLLRRCTVGRVAVEVDGTAPLVVPVNYRVDDDTIVFRTDAGTKLDAVGGLMSFEIDDIDHGRHAGWSVLVRGRTHHDDDGRSGVDPEPWTGTKEHRVRLAMDDVTGRRIVIPSMPPDDRGYR